jgi:hypothetical protein
LSGEFLGPHPKPEPVKAYSQYHFPRETRPKSLNP